MIAGAQDEMATERKESEMRNMRKENRSEHKHLNTPLFNIEMMKETKAGRRVRPQGVSAEVVGMAGNKENRKEEKGSGEPFPNIEGTPELSEEEIMKILQARQQYERALEMARKYKEILKTAEEKKKEIKPQILREIKEKYGLEEKDIKEAFRDIENEGEIMEDIKNAIREEGAQAFERKDIKEKAEKIRKIERIYRMSREEIKKLAVIFEEARKYMEEREAEEGEKEIHHAGNMSEESIKLLQYVKEQGGRVTWAEFKRYGKEELHLDTDTLNKRRWGLVNRGYLKKEQGGRELVLTKAGLARLREEGH